MSALRCFLGRHMGLPLIFLFRVYSEMVNFVSEQGMRIFETAGIVYYFEDFRNVKTQFRAERHGFWTDST